MVLNKKTKDAPNAVNSQVKIVAINAPLTGFILEKKSIRAFICSNKS
jgi:hypothetical protein